MECELLLKPQTGERRWTMVCVSITLSPSTALRQTLQITVRDHGYRSSASRGMPVCSQSFSGIYWQRNGCNKLAYDPKDWSETYTETRSPIRVLTAPDVDYLRRSTRRNGYDWDLSRWL